MNWEYRLLMCLDWLSRFESNIGSKLKRKAIFSAMWRFISSISKLMSAFYGSGFLGDACFSDAFACVWRRREYVSIYFCSSRNNELCDSPRKSDINIKTTFGDICSTYSISTRASMHTQSSHLATWWTEVCCRSRRPTTLQRYARKQITKRLLIVFEWASWLSNHEALNSCEEK